MRTFAQKLLLLFKTDAIVNMLQESCVHLCTIKRSKEIVDNLEEIKVVEEVK